MLLPAMTLSATTMLEMAQHLQPTDGEVPFGSCGRPAVPLEVSRQVASVVTPTTLSMP